MAIAIMFSLLSKPPVPTGPLAFCWHLASPSVLVRFVIRFVALLESVMGMNTPGWTPSLH